MILRAQMDATPAFEAEEAEDARALGKLLLASGSGGAETTTALETLRLAVDATKSARGDRIAIHTAIDTLVKASAADGAPDFCAKLGKIIVAHQTPRTMKDRKWFQPMGFDAGI
jgi:hypothetical protein